MEEGLEAALARKPQRKPRDVTFDGAFDARFTALACAPPPQGHQQWTVRLLADKLVEVKIVDSVSRMTVQRSLKKRVIPNPKRLWTLPLKVGASGPLVRSLNNGHAVRVSLTRRSPFESPSPFEDWHYNLI